MLRRTTALLTTGLLVAAASAQQPVPCLPPTASTTATQPRMVVVPYQVAELVIPVGSPGKEGKTPTTCEDDLIKMIQDKVSPKTWASHGGRGTIDYFPMTMTLVISQTPDIQEQVADLLSALRRLQNTEVALEVRLVTVPDQVFERIGVDFNAPAGCPNGQCPAKVDAKAALDGAAFLKDTQVFQFLEAIQGDQRANVMQAPKITLLDNQMGQVDCTDKQMFVTGVEVVQRDGRPVVTPKNEEIVTGFHMSACPKVSADRRFVMLDLDINQTDPASPAVPLFPVTVQIKDSEGKPHEFTQFLQQPRVNTMRIQKRLSIPDGGTVLLGGMKKEVEARAEFGPPVLSRVPYANRLFKNVGTARESQMVYVLVTPRVIVSTEEEQRPPTCPAKAAACWTTAPKACGAEKSQATAAPAALPVPRLVRPNATGHWEECGAVAPPAHGPAKVIEELRKAYDEACAAGHKDEAAKLAQAALILDPTCFAKSRGK
jgi:type II secretory pathway component GspD/PulD (secretin)